MYSSQIYDLWYKELKPLIVKYKKYVNLGKGVTTWDRDSDLSSSPLRYHPLYTVHTYLKCISGDLKLDVSINRISPVVNTKDVAENV